MMKPKKNRISLSLITLLILFSFALSAGTASVDEQIAQLKSIIDASSYSDFQSRMVLNTVQDLLRTGVSFEDTKKMIENSVQESFDAYSVKRVFDIILETQQEGLSTEPLINKVNEGFAKKVNKSVIITAISSKAENLRKANAILNEALSEGLKINGEKEMVDILADSLENDVPQESLSWLVKTGTAEGRSITEISEISEELSYLSLMAYDAGLSSEELSLLFKQGIENSIHIDEICENIQTSLESQMSTAKTEAGGTAKPSSTAASGTLPASSAGSPAEVGPTPAQEAGEAPDAPEPSTPPAEETPAPPEN